MRGLLLVLVSAVLLTGCGGSKNEEAATTAGSTVFTVPDELPQRERPKVETTETVVETPRSPPPRGLLDDADLRSFAKLESSLGGTSGVAVAGAGRNAEVVTAGSLQEGVAWSTIKVPIALATITSGAGPSDQMRAAITASDNAAAEQLWRQLGTPAAAGAAVEEVLREAGDRTTSVETSVLRQGFSSFGQTVWSLQAQAALAAALPCMAEAAPVRALMSQVISSQRWGLGTLGPGVELKGGWGPGTDGRYLVRQFGLVPVGDKLLGVSVATVAADGTFEGGIANLGAIAGWLGDHISAARLDNACG